MSPDVPTAILAAVFLLALLAMRRGWRRRAARTAFEGTDAAEPAPVAAHDLGASRTLPVPAVYAGTTRRGDWLDRVVAHGLGGPAGATVQVFDGGLRVERPGRGELVIPAADLLGARLAPGLAGRVVGGGRMVVVAWRHADQDLETGLLPRYGVDRPLLVAAVEDLTRAADARPATPRTIPDLAKETP